jgi:hypothetical protein
MTFWPTGGGMHRSRGILLENDDLVLLRGIFTLSYTDEDAKPQQMITHSVEVAKRAATGCGDSLLITQPLPATSTRQQNRDHHAN